MKFATLLTISTTAYGLAFDGPLPTPVTDLVYAALDGFTPKPTNNVRALPDLFRRQQKPANSAICGYLDSDPDFPLSCTAGASCIFNTAQKWFGCCKSGGSASASANCEVVTRCINSASVSSCLEDSSCFNDPLAIACTASSAPFCINMYAKIPEGTMSHWVCGASATSVGVSASATSEPPKSSGASARKSKDASAILQNNGQSTGGAGGGSNGPTATGAGVIAASKGGAAMATAGALAGVAGGLVGAFAVFL
ncbi:hypothetical protein GQ44DRAFT_772188 [Phaeosphaeriaceae sp. PMI808]|nr:hypothetical protein GQ44DRAFT_772188 [Phaeosphaeriaceae sp. PMI808]